MRANFQVQVLSSLFFRNKGAYVVGKIINGFTEMPFALPILHVAQGGWRSTRRCSARTTCCWCSACARLLHGQHGGPGGLRAVPALADAPKAAFRDLQRDRPAETGKNIFYRDFLYHLRHSTDRFRIAPGIRAW